MNRVGLISRSWSGVYNLQLQNINYYHFHYVHIVCNKMGKKMAPSSAPTQEPAAIVQLVCLRPMFSCKVDLLG